MRSAHDVGNYNVDEQQERSTAIDRVRVSYEKFVSSLLSCTEVLSNQKLQTDLGLPTTEAKGQQHVTRGAALAAWSQQILKEFRGTFTHPRGGNIQRTTQHASASPFRSTSEADEVDEDDDDAE